MKNIIKLLALLPLFATTACDDLFEPAIENNRDLDAMYSDADYALGVLGNGYILLPYNTSPTSDVATDDAVSNDNSNTWRAMATGAWTAQNDPASQWKNCYNAIQYLNLFLERVESVPFSMETNIQTLFVDSYSGEAYGLRAVYMYYLLRAHGGIGTDGQLLGVPIKTTSESPESDFSQPRDTYADCIEQILSDCDKAIELLPLDYKDGHTESEIPQKYLDLGINTGQYDRVNGVYRAGRISGRIVEAIRAQVTLMAASPAFAESGITWEEAANSAGTILQRIDGINGIDADGYTWYCNTSEIAGLGNGSNPQEIIWRAGYSDDNTLEGDNFPPSLYGNGRVNPTQNLVDAFPMANGYPIDNSNSNYDANDPYANRDPRLATYIITNGSTAGSTTITTGSYGTNNDAINRESGHSTRTGYYMRKHLRFDCNLDPNYNTKQRHYSARIRYTEIFLDYAEAANEAWGPKGTGSFGFSAYDVIKAIRTRAGVGTDNGDPYLEACANSQDQMRELIRNERRLELCFENIRFYDLRRWNADLTEAAQGVNISRGTGGALTYTPIQVEERNYRPYMNYGPIPYNDVLNFGFIQNQGW